MILRVPADIFGCVDPQHPLHTVPKSLRQFLSIINWYCLIWVLYKRLLFVFTDSEHALSSKTKIIFKVIYIAPILIILLCVIFYYVTNKQSLIVLILGGLVFMLCLIGMSIWLILLFGIKLKRLFNELNALDVGNDTKELNATLVRMMTRYFILCTVSLSMGIFSLFVYVIIFAIDDGKDSSIIQDIQEILTIMFMMDIFTNVICMYLQVASSTNLYLKVCGCLDKWCQRKWDKNKNQREISLASVNTNTSKSPATSSNESTENAIAVE